MDYQVKENELKVKFYNHIIKKYSNLKLKVPTLEKFILECSSFVDIEESENIILLKDKYNECFKKEKYFIPKEVFIIEYPSENGFRYPMFIVDKDEFQYLNSMFNWEDGTNIDLQKEWNEFKNNIMQELTKDIDTINLF